MIYVTLYIFVHTIGLCTGIVTAHVYINVQTLIIRHQECIAIGSRTTCTYIYISMSSLGVGTCTCTEKFVLRRMLKHTIW
jgi:hypothetical protein